MHTNTDDHDRVSRRADRRSLPPDREVHAPSIDGPSDEAGTERVMDSSDFFRVDHARQLRDLLQRFAAEYDLEEHKERFGRPVAWSEASTGTGALCADPGSALAGMLSALNAAINGAEQAGVDHG